MELSYSQYGALLGLLIPYFCVLIFDNVLQLKLYYLIYVKKNSHSGRQELSQTMKWVLFRYSGGIPGEYRVPAALRGIYNIAFIHCISPLLQVWQVMLFACTLGFCIGFAVDWITR